MKLGKFEIDDYVIIMLLFVILILSAAWIGYSLDSKDKEIEKLKIERDLEITRAAIQNDDSIVIDKTK